MIEVVVSIKPEFSKLIVQGIKNYEFRKYIPKKGINRLWIYTSSPICQLEYVAEIDNIVIYPEKISEDGFGNEDFNKGLKKSKNAYHIKHLYKLSKPLKLNELRESFAFTAPQSFFYLDSNQKLCNYLSSLELLKIF